MRLIAKRVCWLLIEVARQDTESLQPLERPIVGLATYSFELNFIIPPHSLESVK